MNQILSTGNSNNNNKYNNTDIKKIIKIFCVLVIVVAFVICVAQLFDVYKKKNKKYATPEISLIKGNEDEFVTLKAKCPDGINYISYSWNDENETKVNLNGAGEYERTIDIPKNRESIFKVNVVSSNNVQAQKTEKFENGVDRAKPVIESINIVNSKLQIVATDNVGIDYIEYEWKDEEPNQIHADSEDNSTMNAEIDIQRGTFELKITVVDTSGNKEVLSKLITGVNEPEINFIKYDDIVHVTVTHDMGFKRIEYAINKKVYVYSEKYSGYNKNDTTVEFDFPLEEGNNIIQVTAYSLEKISDEAEDTLENYAFKVKKGKCTYEAD